MINRKAIVDALKNRLNEHDLVEVMGLVSEETGEVPEFERIYEKKEGVIEFLVSYINENGEKVKATYNKFIKEYLNVERVADIICEFEELDYCDVGYLFEGK